MLSKLKTLGQEAQYYAGQIWGKTTTMVLAIVPVVLGYLQLADKSILEQFPQIGVIVFFGGLFLLVLRQIAPPPPAIVVDRKDSVLVDKDDGTVTVTKGASTDTSPTPTVVVNEGGQVSEVSPKILAQSDPTRTEKV